MYRRSGRGDLRCPCLADTAAGSAHGWALQQWVFVQKCLLERKRSYLTEKGLFSRKAPGGRWIRTFGTAARKLRGTHIQNDEQRRISYCRGSDAQLFACDGATDALAG